MRILVKAFLISITILAAGLFWFKPADNLISLKPVDWAQKYKDETTKQKSFYGASSMAKKNIREGNAKLTLDEFIVKKIDGRLIKVNSPEWQTWIKERLSSRNVLLDQATYFSSDNFLMSSINLPLGYLEIKSEDRKDYVWFNRLQPNELGGKFISAKLRYPNRKTSVILLACLCLYFLISKLFFKRENLVEQSGPGKGIRFFIWVFTAGVVFIYLPFFYGWIQDSPPFIFLGGFIMISGIVGLVMFGYQYVFTYNLIEKKKGLLAHWSFTPKEWNKYTEKEYKTEQGEKKGLLVFISVIILIVGGVFWLIVRDQAAGIVFLVLLGLIALLSFVAVIVPRLNYRRNIKRPGQIFISKDGLYLNGSVHTWFFAGARFKDIEYLTKPFNCLNITYSYWMMAGRMLFFYRNISTVRVPVPKGQEDQANYIVDKFNK